MLFFRIDIFYICIFIYYLNVLTVTFDQFNTSFLNLSIIIIFLILLTLNFWMVLYFFMKITTFYLQLSINASNTFSNMGIWFVYKRM